MNPRGDQPSLGVSRSRFYAPLSNGRVYVDSHSVDRKADPEWDGIVARSFRPRIRIDEEYQATLRRRSQDDGSSTGTHDSVERVGDPMIQRADQHRQSDGQSTQTNGQPSVMMGVHVDLWIRENVPTFVGETQERVHERLHRLEESGGIDSFATSQWGDPSSAGIRTSGEVAQSSRKTLRRFRSWASGNDISLQPGFQMREIDSMFIEDVREEIVLPAICLAVYCDNALAAVFPHVDCEGVHTVDDALDRLEADDRVLPAGGERA